jgi:hypothetical protein
MIKIKTQRRLNFITSTANEPSYMPKSLMTSSPTKEKVKKVQKNRDTDIQISKRTPEPRAIVRKPVQPYGAKRVKTSFFFPLSLIKTLKSHAFENKVSLSDYISGELKRKLDKKVDIASIKKQTKAEKTTQLCLVLPEEIVNSIKKESINYNVPFTYVMLGKLQ